MSMMLNEDQELLRDAAAGFLNENAPVSAFRELRDSNSTAGFSRDLWSEMAQMGWAGILVPEEFGGSEFGMVGAGLIAEEMGKHLTASPFLATSVLAATAFSKFGSEAQKENHLPKISAGETLYALAVDEGAKHAPAKTALKAERSGNGFKLSGAKTFVANGHVADHVIVAARTSGEAGDENGITLFLVEAETAGLQRSASKMVDSSSFARLQFEDVEVNADAVIGEVDFGYEPLDTILNAGRACLAAEMSGCADQAFNMTVAYINERKQFGVPVGSFQALQHRAAHLHTEIELAKAVTLAALQSLDTEEENAWRLTALAKTKVGQVALLAAQEGVQMHGGMGMTDAFDIGLYLKRVRVAGELFGDESWHANRIADALSF